METYTAYRDEPVDFIETLVDYEGKLTHYRCVKCNSKIWTSNDDALEDFVTEHETCTA